MKHGKYEHSRKRRRSANKSVALLLALTLAVGCAIGGTIAWLTDSTDEVENTFTVGNINIDLTETWNTDSDGNNEADSWTGKMIPGWTIAKDPKVTVDSDSEDCWLFVKITESTDPDLDDYISYAIADGWQIVQPTDSNGDPVTSIANADEIVIGRKVYKDDTTKAFDILGAGEYTDPMDADDPDDDFKITWSANQVCVKPSVTEQMMEAISTNKPTLSFQAYAVQLFKTNSDGVKANTDDEFTAAEAWARAADMSTTP